MLKAQSSNAIILVAYSIFLIALIAFSIHKSQPRTAQVTLIEVTSTPTPLLASTPEPQQPTTSPTPAPEPTEVATAFALVPPVHTVEPTVAPTRAPTRAPTLPPTRTPTPPPVVQAPSPTGASWQAVVAAYFPEQPAKAISVVMCESGGVASTNTGNGYYGAYQFDLPTWQSVGGSGLPSNASLEEQSMRARALYNARGWQPWGCS